MKCPKCHYLSFDPEPRCRNCGYDLELAEDLDLGTAEGAVEGPLVDLKLRDADAPRRAPITLELVRPAGPASRSAEPPSASMATAAAGVAEPPALDAAADPLASVAARSAGSSARAASPAPEARQAPAARPSTTSELPLFVKQMPEDRASDRDRPMISVPAVPRPPLSVRRKTPEPPRPRTRVEPVAHDRKLGPLERDLLEDLQRVEREEALADLTARASLPRPHPPQAFEEAAISIRLAAAAVDSLVIAAIGGGVLFATLRLCGLSADQAAVLPMLPLAAFLLIISAGYLLMFTIAGGQTLGKMAMGIRVVAGGDTDAPPVLTVRQAAYRELLSLPLVGALGAGYLPAVLGRGPAVHDRLAETRVVRG